MSIITRSKRYVPRAQNRYVFIPTVATMTGGVPAPTSSEINAGIDLTGEVNEVNGFATKTNFVETSDAGTRFKGKLVASEEADDASIAFNASEDGDDVRKILSKGQRGFMLIALGGLTEGYVAEVHEVIVGSVSSVKTLDAAALINVGFSVPSRPNEAFEIPAGVTISA